MDNPFRYSGPIVKEDEISGSTHVERIDIVNEYLKLTIQGEYVQVIGPHQSGRTTLALDLIDRLLPENDLEQSVIPILISCESLMDANREGFIRTIMTRLRRVLDEGVPEDTCQKITSTLISENNYPKTFLDLYLLLVEIGKELKNTKRYSHFVFLLDEIEAMPDNLVKDMLLFFRSLFSNYAERRWDAPYRVIIFTTHDLAYWKLGRSSPYNISNIIRLTSFSQEEFDTMLDDQHIGKALPNITFNKSSRERIMTESGGFPYFIQRLCHIVVEKYPLKGNKKVYIGDKEVLKAVLEFFEKGDDNLQNIYQEASQDSNEWKLCKMIAAGHRETYFANDPAINKLVGLGIIVDVEGYCKISTGLYKRQILKIYFNQEYQTAIEALSDNEQLLLNTSCLQEILLNKKINKLVLSRIEDLMQDDRKTEIEIHTKLSDYLDRVLKDQECNLDMEEIHTFTDHYNMKRVKYRKEVILLLIKAFIGSFNENNTTE